MIIIQQTFLMQKGISESPMPRYNITIKLKTSRSYCKTGQHNKKQSQEFHKETFSLLKLFTMSGIGLMVMPIVVNQNAIASVLKVRSTNCIRKLDSILI